MDDKFMTILNNDTKTNIPKIEIIGSKFGTYQSQFNKST